MRFQHFYIMRCPVSYKVAWIKFPGSYHLTRYGCVTYLQRWSDGNSLLTFSTLHLDNHGQHCPFQQLRRNNKIHVTKIILLEIWFTCTPYRRNNPFVKHQVVVLNGVWCYAKLCSLTALSQFNQKLFHKHLQAYLSGYKRIISDSCLFDGNVLDSMISFHLLTHHNRLLSLPVSVSFISNTPKLSYFYIYDHTIRSSVKTKYNTS